VTTETTASHSKVFDETLPTTTENSEPTSIDAALIATTMDDVVETSTAESNFDCAVLNAWLPQYAFNTCCSQEGITCVEDRITEMYVLLTL
jgi:hypothetical protein